MAASLGTGGARSRIPCGAVGSRLARGALRRRACPSAIPGVVVARPRARTGNADRHHVRQQRRPRAPRARRAIRRRSARTPRRAVFARTGRLSAPAIRGRNGAPENGFRGRRRSLRRGARATVPRRNREGRGAQRGRRCDDVRRLVEERRQRRRRCRARDRRTRHVGENHLHVGLDRKPEGRADDARHAVRESGANGCRHAGHPRAPAKNPRLAAVESCVRRQPQLQHDARERRQPIHRRGQADEGRLRGVSPQHPRTRRKPCVQRADRLCATRRRDGEGQRPQARLPRQHRLRRISGRRSRNWRRRCAAKCR